MKRIDLKKVAADLLKCALTGRSLERKLIGNITKHELAALAAAALDDCPDYVRTDIIGRSFIVYSDDEDAPYPDDEESP